MSGNLSHQIEHRLFPDLPSNRYAEIAPRVRALCQEYGLPYTTGPLGRQYLSTWRRILRLSLPGGHPRSATGGDAKGVLQPGTAATPLDALVTTSS
jgi:linoleoyl-CoA desaturase